MVLPAITVFGINIVSFSFDLLTFFAIYLAISISLNLELGYAGIPNFGKALMVAAGGSIGGSFAGQFAAWYLHVDTQGGFFRHWYTIIPQVSTILEGDAWFSVALLFMTILVGALAGGAIGYLASFPALRLREDYLAMILLAMAQLYVIFLANTSVITDSTDGLAIPDVFRFAGEWGPILSTGTIVAFAALVYLYAERVARSPLGRMLRAMRDNEVAAEALGKDTVKARRNVLIVASMITGAAGALWAFQVGISQPGEYTRFVWTIYPWVMVIMGGAANNFGVALGTMVFWFILKFVDIAKFSFSAYVPFEVNYLQYMTVGAILLLILYFRPEGILKEKSTATTSSSRLRGLFGGDKKEPG
ncbi:MAG: branched-chain amino acid ABC transporter permease [archaeon]|nr:MAG: branched-chain amino acid ABC transporter permease [archaeon]